MNSFNMQPKEGYGFIYKYTSPSGKKYIGQTFRSLKDRAKTKDGSGYIHSTVFYAAIQKYGFENFSWEILGEFPIEELDEKEKYYILIEDSLAPNGYNIQRGGKEQYNLRGKRISSIKQYDINGNFIKEYPSVIDAANDNNTNYQSIVAVLTKKRSQHNGFIYTYKNEPAPQPVQITKTHGRKTAQYNLDGELIEIYPSANQAALAIGQNKNAGRNIRSVCEGKRKTAFGFKWKYLD